MGPPDITNANPSYKSRKPKNRREMGSSPAATLCSHEKSIQSLSGTPPEGPSSSEAMGEDLGGAIIAMEAKDQRENLSPSRGHGGGSTRGRTSPPLSRWHRSAIGREIIAAVIVFNNITILISFTRSTLPHPVVIPT